MTDKPKTCLARGCPEPRNERFFLCDPHLRQIPPVTYLEWLEIVQHHPKRRQEIADFAFNFFWDKPKPGHGH